MRFRRNFQPNFRREPQDSTVKDRLPRRPQRTRSPPFLLRGRLRNLNRFRNLCYFQKLCHFQNLNRFQKLNRFRRCFRTPDCRPPLERWNAVKCAPDGCRDPPQRQKLPASLDGKQYRPTRRRFEEAWAPSPQFHVLVSAQPPPLEPFPSSNFHRSADTQSSCRRPRVRTRIRISKIEVCCAPCKGIKFLQDVQ